MWVHMRDKEVIVRKKHRCYLCGEDIEKGEEAISRTGSDPIAGEIFTFHMHLECEDESQSWSYDDWEVTSPYSMPRPKERYKK